MQQNPVHMGKIDFLKFYRAKDWMNNLGIVVVALLIGQEPSVQNFLLVLSSVALAHACAFSLNDFFDYKIFKQKNYISQLKNEKIVTILVAFPVLVLAVLQFWLNNPLMLLFVLLYTIYSAPPFVLKRNFLFSITLNSICIGFLTFTFAYLQSGYAHFMFWNLALPLSVVFSAYVAMSEIIHQISHMKEDRKNGILSLPNRFGIKSSLKVAAFVQLIPPFLFAYYLSSSGMLNILWISSIFSFLRIHKILRINTKLAKWGLLRKRMYGLEEGLAYLLFLIILVSL